MKPTKSSRSTLLIDCVFDSIAEDCRPVTAKEVSRRWGADRVRVLEYLNGFRKLGLCRSLDDRGPEVFVGVPVKIEIHQQGKKLS